ncbi:replication initiator protein A [Mesobacillus harenae]|uniref:replication initiator protein A n=1 Tax=Mesobacillus harenae TaxID=2213203 RepID=UPI001581027D
MQSDNYFFAKDLRNEEYFFFPKCLMTNHNYKGLSFEAIIFWSLLFDLQKLCSQKGWSEPETGRVFILEPLRLLELYRREEIISPLDSLKELIHFNLIEASEPSESGSSKYFLLKPYEDEKDALEIEKKREEYFRKMENSISTHSSTLSQQPETIQKANSHLLKKFILDQKLQDETLINELYNRCIVGNSVQEITYQQIKKIYQMIIDKPAGLSRSHSAQQKHNSPDHQPEGELSNSESDDSYEKALKFMESYLSGSERTLLADDSILILYKHFDKMTYLRENNLFNLPLMLTLKNEFKLNKDRFNLLLDEALEAYDYSKDLNELPDFTKFFKTIIENEGLFYKDQILIRQITEKLFALPDHLKSFVYEQMKKADSYFPERYALVMNNFRAVNTVYQERGSSDLPDEVFQMAFRRLFMADKIYSIASYFSKAIQYIQSDLQTKGQKQVPVLEVPDDSTDHPESNWVEKIVNLKDTKGAIEKMSAEEQDEYRRQAKALKEKLAGLRNK